MTHIGPARATSRPEDAFRVRLVEIDYFQQCTSRLPATTQTMQSGYANSRSNPTNDNRRQLKIEPDGHVQPWD